MWKLSASEDTKEESEKQEKEEAESSMVDRAQNKTLPPKPPADIMEMGLAAIQLYLKKRH